MIIYAFSVSQSVAYSPLFIVSVTIIIIIIVIIIIIIMIIIVYEGRRV